MPHSLSVIIPNYNMAHLIREAISSVLAQTWNDYEIIIVNDGSTDSSISVIHEIMSTRQNIRCIDNKKNQGAIASVNKGIKAAKGKYIYLLAADDKILDPLFFSIMIPPLERSPSIAMSTSDHGMFLDGEDTIHVHKVFPHVCEARNIPAEVFLNLCATGQIKYWLFAMGTIFRKELFTNHGLFLSDLPVLSDWYLIHLFALNHGCFYIPGTYVAWRHRGGNNLYHHMKKNEVALLLSLIGKSKKNKQLFKKSFLLECYVKQALFQIAFRPYLWTFLIPFFKRKLFKILKRSPLERFIKSHGKAF